MAKKKVEDPITHEVTEVDDGQPEAQAPETSAAKPWEVAEAQPESTFVETVEEKVEEVAEAQPEAEAAEEPSLVEAIEEKAEEAVEVVEDFVTVTVPRYFRLTLSNHTVKEIQPGVQPMLREHAEHWWSKANGVVEYAKVQLAAELPQAITIKQLVSEKFQALDALAEAEKEAAIKELFSKLQEAIKSVG